MRDLLQSIGLREDILQADRNDLDNEFERHPQALADVADALATARKLLDLAKLELGKIERRVRAEQAEVPREKKATVKDIDTAVQGDPEVRKQARVVVACEHDVQRWAGLLSGMQAKTSSLKHLSELYQAGYYTTNRSSAPRRMRRDE